MRISDGRSDVCSSDLDADLPGAGQDRVFEVRAERRLDRRVDPLSGGGAVLAEHVGPDAVGAQRPVEDVHRDLEPFAARLRRYVPVGDDHAAERVGRGQRHEGQGVERGAPQEGRSEEHTSELQSLMRISYAVFCLKKKKKTRLTLSQAAN